MPQPVTISISLGTHDPKKVGNGNAFLPQPKNGITACGQQPHPAGPTSTSGAAVAHECNINNHGVAKGAPRPPPSHPPIKRTKKIAKPKTKAKKKVPTKHTKQLPKKKAKVDDAPSKPVPIGRKKGGKKSVSTTAKRKSPLPKKIQTEKQDKKANSKMPTSTQGGPAKKRARKKKSQDPVINNPSPPTSQESNEKASKTPPDNVKTDQELDMTPPLSDNKKSKIETMVIEVVDTIANEISYCAPMFGTKHPRVVIRSEEEDYPDKNESKNSAGDNLEDLNSNKKSKGDSPSLKIRASNIVSTQIGVAALSTSNNVRVTKGGALSSAKNDNLTAKTGKRANLFNKKDPTSVLPVNVRRSVSQMYDVSTVVLAVKRFVMEVYFPFLHSANMNMENSSPNYDRIQISTFIAIREMLIMNADKLFTLPKTKHSSTDCAKKERFYALRVLANAIVRNAAKRLHLRHSGSPFFANFIQAAQNYDARTDDFQFSLARADARTEYSRSDEETVGRQESVLAKIGFNYARERHPLLHSTQITSEDQSKRLSMQYPVPSACAAFHIEVDTGYTSDESVDEAGVMESLKNVLKSKRSTSTAK